MGLFLPYIYLFSSSSVARLAAEYPSIAAQKAGLDMKQADDSMHDFPPFQYCEQAAMEALQQHGTFLGRMYRTLFLGSETPW